MVDAQRCGLAIPGPQAWRVLMLGVDDPRQRAAMLTAGCAEALPSTIGLHELEARASRIDAALGMLPRRRMIGSVMLDLFHRDARCRGRWLALHPREFELLWRLADDPGVRVSRGQLLRDVWRVSHEPETNSVEVHVSRLRMKLAQCGCRGLVVTDPLGGYHLANAADAGSCEPARANELVDTS